MFTRRWSWLLSSSLGVAAWLAPSEALADDPVLERGTKQIGGQLRLDYERDMYDAHDSGYTLSIVPGFGYFIADRLEVRVGLAADVELGALHAGATQTFGFDGGIRYYLRLGKSVAGYAGMAFGPAVAVPDAGKSATTLVASLPFGVLVAFNRYVAMDLGARVEYSSLVSTRDGSVLRLALGYFGVQAFLE